jgi:outer membrane murein-binding lipoprotein Lpp
MTRAILLAFLLAGCANNSPMTGLSGQQSQLQQAMQRKNEAFSNMLAHQQAAFQARLVEIRKLPLDQRDAALDQLEKDEDAWHREVQAMLDQESRDLDRQQALDAQRDLTDAIRDLSDQIGQAQVRY